jgi:hypothetical protein
MHTCTARKRRSPFATDSGNGERSGLAIAAYCAIIIVVLLALVLLVLIRRRKDTPKPKPKPVQSQDDKFSFVSEGMLPGEPIYFRAKNHPHVYDSLPASLLHNPSHILYDNLRRNPRKSGIPEADAEQEHDYQLLDDPGSSLMPSLVAVPPPPQTRSPSSPAPAAPAAAPEPASRRSTGLSSAALSLSNSIASSSGPVYSKPRKPAQSGGALVRIGTASSSASASTIRSSHDGASRSGSSSSVSTLGPSPLPTAAPEDGATPVLLAAGTEVPADDSGEMPEGWNDVYVPLAQLRNTKLHGNETDFLARVRSSNNGSGAGVRTNASVPAVPAIANAAALPSTPRPASSPAPAQATPRASVDPTADAAVIAANAAATAAAIALAAARGSLARDDDTHSIALSACDFGQPEPEPSATTAAYAAIPRVPPRSRGSDAIYEAPHAVAPLARLDSMAQRYGYGDGHTKRRAPTPPVAPTTPPTTATAAADAHSPVSAATSPASAPLPTLSSVALARGDSATESTPTLTSLPSLIAIPIPARSTSPTPSNTPSAAFSNFSLPPRREPVFQAAPMALPGPDSSKPWFHGLMTRTQAAALLRRTIRSVPPERRDGVFIVREQAAAPIDDRLFLCVFSGGCVHEYRVRCHSACLL